MKKLVILLSVVAMSSSYAAFSVNLDAGQLTGPGGAAMQADAAAPHSNGSLLLLIAAGGDNTFSNSLSPGQYVSGNDVVLAAGGFDTNGGTNETLTSFTNLSGTSGDLIALRWFPDITYAQFLASATPSAGNSFGTYNPLTAGNGTNNPDGGDPWAVPSSNSGQLALNFFTTNSDGGGTQAPSEGFANFTVVPEPSTIALLTVGTALGIGTLRRRKVALS
jgi:hypothetical protein